MSLFGGVHVHVDSPFDDYMDTSIPMQQHSDNGETSLMKKVSETFDAFRKKWTIVSKSMISIRLSMNAVKSRFPKWEARLNVPSAGMGVASGVNVLIYPVIIYRECQDISEQTRIGDNEGVALTGIGIAALAGDTLDTAMTVGNSLVKLDDGLSVPEWFSYVGLPTAMFLTASGLVIRGINVKNTKEFLKRIEDLQLDTEYLSPSSQKDKLQEFAKEYVDITVEEAKQLHAEALQKVTKGYETFYEKLCVKWKGRKKLLYFDVMKEKCETLKKKKEKRLRRRTSGNVVERMKEISQGKVSNATNVIKDTETLSKRKIKVGYFALSNSAVTLITLTLLFLSILVPYVAIAILAATAFGRLGIYLYETYYIEKDLTALQSQKEEPGWVRNSSSSDEDSLFKI